MLSNIQTSGYAVWFTAGGQSASPKTPKNTSFLGVTQPQGSHSPYILRDTTRPRHVTYVQVSSKSDQRRLRKTSAQTNGQTNRHYENNGDLAVNQKCKKIAYSWYQMTWQGMPNSYLNIHTPTEFL